MDPQAAMFSYGGAIGSCHGVSNARFDTAEIWPFPISSGLTMSYALGPPADDVNALSMSDAMVLDRRVIPGCGRAWKLKEGDECAMRGASTSGNSMSETEGKRLKTSGQDNKPDSETGVEGNSRKQEEQAAKTVEPPKDYIHVRARRGQATDSHSLAERARREKISERMKILQDLVPGCNKVIGKALVLDEIINYIQSLQNQVEFLSMKLETLNSTMTSTVEGLLSKDFPHQAIDTTTALAFGLQSKREYPNGTSPTGLHFQIGGGGFQRTP